jgi:hypothetical protein
MSALELVRIVVLVYAMGVPGFALFAVQRSPYEQWKTSPFVTFNMRKLYLFVIAIVALFWPATIGVLFAFKLAKKIDFTSDDDPDDPQEQS